MKIKTEKQKMLDGEPFHTRDPEIREDKLRAIHFLNKFKLNENPWNAETKLKGFLGGVGTNVKISRDFDTTFGYNLFIGSNVSINRGCKFLDAGKIVIGDNCLIGPSVHFYSVTHSIDPKVRLDPINRDLVFISKIVVENNVWIGGHSTILPGVTIGENSVVGAGSVVVKNVPKNVVVVGNPAKVIKKI